MELFTPLRMDGIEPDLRDLGGKAQSLLSLSSRDIHVPPGFAIPAAHARKAWESTLRNTDSLETNELAHRLRGTMARSLIRQVDEESAKVDAPHGFAVRSSGLQEDGRQHSYAGIYDSFLGVARSDLPDAIARVWASGGTARAREYTRRAAHRAISSGVGVIVQATLSPRAAGVIFTINPANAEKDTALVEAVWGLGDHFLAGRVNPDIYEINRRSQQEVDATVTTQTTMRLPCEAGGIIELPVPQELTNRRKLTSEDLVEVARTALEIERHDGVAQDVEFAIDEVGLYILQARPITSPQGKSTCS